MKNLSPGKPHSSIILGLNSFIIYKRKTYRLLPIIQWKGLILTQYNTDDDDGAGDERLLWSKLLNKDSKTQES